MDHKSREERQFVESLMYGLSAPFIFPPGGWGDSIPKQTRDLALIYRLAELPQIIEQEQCTKFEAMMYLSCCSLVAPLTHDAYKMMMHCMKKYYGLDKIDDNPERIKYLEQDATLFENEEQELSRIRSTIFKRQMERIKSECRSTGAKTA